MLSPQKSKQRCCLLLVSDKSDLGSNASPACHRSASNSCQVDACNDRGLGPEAPVPFAKIRCAAITANTGLLTSTVTAMLMP